MIGTIDITVNAQHPNVPLSPIFSWRGSASRINVEGVPCLCGSWYVASVSISIATPDGKTVTYPCQRTSNGIYSATIGGTDTPGKSANGITITAQDEAGKDYVLGRGDLYILDGAAIPAPGDVSWSVRLLSSKPESPKEGDAYFDEDGTLMVYSGGSWRNTMPSATVPTKVSEFENDAGYITSKQVKPSTKEGYAADAERADTSKSADKANSVAWSGVTDRPTKLSQFSNDAEYIAREKDANGRKTAVSFGVRSGTVGDNSFANGVENTASGESSHAEGVRTQATGNYSHSEGFGTTSAGYGSHAEGRGGNASAEHSHAEGQSTTASGYCAHSEGNSTTASGDYAHAEGFDATAAGDGSHAEGYKAQTKTEDDYAFSWNGDTTRTEPYISHGKGTFNVNPVGGSDGFYIGEKKLSEVISDGVANKADKATTLAGYGITDAAKKTDLEALASKVDAANTALEEVA